MEADVLIKCTNFSNKAFTDSTTIWRQTDLRQITRVDIQPNETARVNVNVYVSICIAHHGQRPPRYADANRIAVCHEDYSDRSTNMQSHFAARTSNWSHVKCTYLGSLSTWQTKVYHYAVALVGNVLHHTVQSDDDADDIHAENNFPHLNHVCCTGVTPM